MPWMSLLDGVKKGTKARSTDLRDAKVKNTESDYQNDFACETNAGLDVFNLT